MENEHLVPDMIKDLCKKFEKTSNQNEFYVLEDRLKSISDYINKSILKKKNLKYK
jgi:ppGpp synthetase/RelA/SpoT-type nucleotidyltranferase